MKEITAAEMKAHNNTHIDCAGDVYHLGDCPHCNGLKPSWIVKRYIVTYTPVKAWDKAEAIQRAIEQGADDAFDIRATAKKLQTGVG